MEGSELCPCVATSFDASVCFSVGQSGFRTAPGPGEARGGEESGGKRAGTERRCSGKVQVWLLGLVLVLVLVQDQERQPSGFFCL